MLIYQTQLKIVQISNVNFVYNYVIGKFCKKYSAFTDTKFCKENDNETLQIIKQVKGEDETDLFDQDKKENKNEILEPKEKRNNASNRQVHRYC